jgi:hypothetical protein
MSRQAGPAYSRSRRLRQISSARARIAACRSPVHALERHLAGDPAELVGPDEDDEVVITTLDITP